LCCIGHAALAWDRRYLPTQVMLIGAADNIAGALERQVQLLHVGVGLQVRQQLADKPATDGCTAAGSEWPEVERGRAVACAYTGRRILWEAVSFLSAVDGCGSLSSSSSSVVLLTDCSSSPATTWMSFRSSEHTEGWGGGPLPCSR